MASVKLVEYNGECASLLAARLQDAIAEGTVGLIVDLGEHALDSVLLHLVVVTDKTLNARGGRAIVLCDEAGQTALRATGLDMRLPVARSLSDALQLATAYLRRG